MARQFVLINGVRVRAGKSVGDIRRQVERITKNHNIIAQRNNQRGENDDQSSFETWRRQSTAAGAELEALGRAVKKGAKTYADLDKIKARDVADRINPRTAKATNLIIPSDPPAQSNGSGNAKGAAGHES